MDGESEDDAARDSHPMPRDNSHRNQIVSSTNNNFYKLPSQDQLMQPKNERPKSSKGGIRSSMQQNKLNSAQVVHQRSNANIKAQPITSSTLKAIERSDSAKEGMKSSSLNVPHHGQPPFSSSSHVRQNKKVDP